MADPTEDRIAALKVKHAAMKEVTDQIIEQLQTLQTDTIASLRAEIVELKAKLAATMRTDK